MTLLSRLREKRTGSLATAIPAISATQPKGEAATVARIATVAVANLTSEETAPPATHADKVNRLAAAHAGLKLKAGDVATLTANEETAIRAWLALIEETDPAIIAEVIGRCQRDADARDYFTGRAAVEIPKPDPFPDDRRTCSQCLNLRGRVCSVAIPGGLVSANRGYQPMPDVLQRCAGFLPMPLTTTGPGK